MGVCGKIKIFQEIYQMLVFWALAPVSLDDEWHQTYPKGPQGLWDPIWLGHVYLMGSVYLSIYWRYMQVSQLALPVILLPVFRLDVTAPFLTYSVPSGHCCHSSVSNRQGVNGACNFMVTFFLPHLHPRKLLNSTPIYRITPTLNILIPSFISTFIVNVRQ